MTVGWPSDLGPGSAQRGGTGMTTAVVIGSTGGIGRAVVERLLSLRRYDRVVGLARGPQPRLPLGADAGRIDLLDEATIAEAALRIGEVDLVVVATGVLTTDRSRPERTYRALEAESMMELYRINTVGPALVARSFLPLLPPDRRGVFAVLSARVGSISDNHLGGWHSYRASKAALNMLVKGFAIELARTRPLGVCVGLHPGTVETNLSSPFSRSVPEGRLLSPEQAAEALVTVMDGLTPSDSGDLFGWDGHRIAP